MSDSSAKSDGSAPRKLLPWGLALAVVVAIGAILFSLRDATPPLDDTILDERYLSWRENSLLDYDMTVSVVVDGSDEQRHSVTVRGGKLTSQTYNGTARDRLDDSFTVEGLFRTLRAELVQANQPDAEGATGHTILRAVFDETHAVPVLFKRLTSRQGAMSVVIRVEDLVRPDKNVIYSASS